MQKARTFGSSSGDTGMTSEGADFLALIWRPLRLSLERLLLFPTKGNTLEAKDGGFNRFWALSRADPEVGHKGVLWMDREAATWAIVGKREKWGGRGRRVWGVYEEGEGRKWKLEKSPLNLAEVLRRRPRSYRNTTCLLEDCVWSLNFVLRVCLLLELYWNGLYFSSFFFR